MELEISFLHVHDFDFFKIQFKNTPVKSNFLFLLLFQMNPSHSLQSSCSKLVIFTPTMSFVFSFQSPRPQSRPNEKKTLLGWVAEILILLWFCGLWIVTSIAVYQDGFNQLTNQPPLWLLFLNRWNNPLKNPIILWWICSWHLSWCMKYLFVALLAHKKTRERLLCSKFLSFKCHYCSTHTARKYKYVYHGAH